MRSGAGETMAGGPRLAEGRGTLFTAHAEPICGSLPPGSMPSLIDHALGVMRSGAGETTAGGPCRALVDIGNLDVAL